MDKRLCNGAEAYSPNEATAPNSSLLSPPVTLSGPQRSHACPCNSDPPVLNATPMYNVVGMPARRSNILAVRACGKQLLFHGVHWLAVLIAQRILFASCNW